jgi:hypothetical protein
MKEREAHSPAMQAVCWLSTVMLAALTFACAQVKQTPEDRLVAAARADDIAAIDKLLKAGANIDGRGKQDAQANRSGRHRIP